MIQYTQGICQDGAAILKDGQPMTIEEILEELRLGAIYEDRVNRATNCLVCACTGNPLEAVINTLAILDGEDKQIIKATLLRSERLEW